MKICRTCQRCYEDTEATCVEANHGALIPARPGSRLIAEKYRLDRLLGRGGMGAVYAGTHLELDRPVAIKLLLPESISDPQALERFRREARTAARLNHPNVANTYDYGTLPDGEAYLVMELVKGRTLREYLNEHAPLRLKMAVLIARQVAEGIGAAHHSGIVHRDLKPSNIILSRDHHGTLQAKVVDFGISKLKELSTTSGSLTAAGALIGTPRYMSPEQCAGEESDARSDIYSLGVILYEMIAGRPPFDAPTATAIALKHLREAPPEIRELRADLPEPLAQLIMQSLAKAPVERTQTATEFAAQLHSIEMQIAESAAPPDDLAELPFDVNENSVELQGRPLINTNPDERVTTFQAHKEELKTERATEPTSETSFSGETSSAGPVEFNSSHLQPVPHAEETEVRTRITTPTSTPGSARTSRRIGTPLLYASLFVFLLGLATYWFVIRYTSPSPKQTITQATSTPVPIASPSVTTHSPTPTLKSSPTPEHLEAPLIISDTEKQALRASLDRWLMATNSRDLSSLMSFYSPALDAYYRYDHTTRAAVRADKARSFAQLSALEVQRMTDPEISFSADGRRATMRYRKSYTLQGTEGQRRGEVLEEIIWEKTAQGWLIASERDLQVLR